LTNPELELDPYFIMDYVDDDERRTVRFGDVWLPYRRVESYLLLVLTPCQDDTSRTPLEASAEFDMRTLRDDDIVRINYRFYTGFDVLDGSETLLGSGAIVPHECPERIEIPASDTEKKAAEKKPFWESDKSLLVFIPAMWGAFLSAMLAFMMLYDYLDDLFLNYPVGPLTTLTGIGVLSLAWLVTQHMASKHAYNLDEEPALRWKLTTFLCAASVLNITLMLYAIAKQS
jgi:hypothetical protein